VPRQMFNVVVEYSLGKDVSIAEIKTFLERVLSGKINKYLDFNSTSHERYLSGPAIVGHLIIDHAQMVDTETMRGYLASDNQSFKIEHIGKL